MPRPRIVVIVPVYRNIEMTVQCINSAIPGIIEIPGACLVAINDASPEEDMGAQLENLRKQWPEHIKVLTNDKNLGFVRTVNLGIQRFPECDVVLLNSDAVLPSRWLVRLRDDAYSGSNIATVTPLSNNTTICTFPDFLEENDLPYGLNTQQIDHSFSEFHLPCVAAPTGIGFCMYIRRSALDKVGDFDSERFPRGYGEENDFCQRAIKVGLANLISPNLFVFHQGGVSFGDEKAMLVENATRVIDSLHPNYHADVQRFIAKDPLRKARILRFSHLICNLDRPKILHITHGMGGGIRQHVEELMAVVGHKAVSLWLYPDRGEKSLVLRFGRGERADVITFRLPDDLTRLAEILTVLNISLLHYHHTMNLDPAILQLGETLGVPHVLTIHDFYLLSANPTLTDDSGAFPGEYTDEIKNSLYPLPRGLSAAQWRDQHRSLVEGAKFVIFPSHSTRKLFGDYYDLQHAVITPHPEPGRVLKVPIKQWRPKTRRVIAVAGAINKEKGALLLSELAELAVRESKPVDFVLIGYAHSPLPYVRMTGPYESKDLNHLINDYDVDIILIPSRCPETYNYVLSYALGTGLPIMAPNVGAFPERLKGRDATLLFNHLASAREVLCQLEIFIENIEQGAPPRCNCTQVQDYELDFYDNVYLDAADMSKQVRRDGKEFSFDVGRRSEPSLNIRERLLVYIWRIYSQPRMAWVNQIVPFSVRRAVKRLLSRRSLHDIV